MKRLCKFQSAPLTEARGDDRSSAATAQRGLFQSAPLTEARGDAAPGGGRGGPGGFNPLP